MLRYGSRGDEVQQLQQMLADAGFDPGPIDGIFGSKTEAALRAFQNDRGLQDDGVYGPNTREALEGSAGGDDDGGGDEDDDRTVREIIEEDYPTLVWAIDHEELGPLLEEAAEQGWTPDKLTAEVQGTEWYQDTSQRRRQLEVMKQTDPASYRRRVMEAHEYVQNLARQLGVDLSRDRITEIGNQYLFNEFSDDRLTRMIIGRADTTDQELVDQAEAGEVGGAASGAYRQIQDLANAYMLELDAADTADWVRRIIAGEATEASFEQYAQQMALAQMPFLEQFINQGLTPQQALKPYRSTFSRLLDINPAQVDFTNPKYQRALRVQDGDSERLATTSEISENIIREFHDEWNQTSGARQTAMQMSTRIAEMFGRRA